MDDHSNSRNHKAPQDSQNKLDAAGLVHKIFFAIERNKIVTRMRSEGNAALSTLDHPAIGVILVDEEGKVLSANSTAEKVIDRDDCLRKDKGTLICHHREQTDALRSAIQRVVQGMAFVNRAEYIPIPRAQAMPLPLFITSLKQEPHRGNEQRAVAVLFLIDTEAGV